MLLPPSPALNDKRLVLGREESWIGRRLMENRYRVSDNDFLPFPIDEVLGNSRVAMSKMHTISRVIISVTEAQGQLLDSIFAHVKIAYSTTVKLSMQPFPSLGWTNNFQCYDCSRLPNHTCISSSCCFWTFQIVDCCDPIITFRFWLRIYLRFDIISWPYGCLKL